MIATETIVQRQGKMKAAVCTAYGPPEVMRISDMPTPVPGDNGVLIRVCASTVTMGDCEIRTLTLPRWTRVPMRILMGYSKPGNFITGMEFSGVVEGIGRNVTRYKIGDEVFGSSGMSMGANAEYIVRPATGLAIKPKGISHEEAATISVGGINALHFLRKANIKPGQKVLVIGGGGAIGSYGVMLAKYYGAEVTGVDSAVKLDMLYSIGCSHVIDFGKEDFSTNGIKYNVIFDTVYVSRFSKCVDSLTDGGSYLMANTDPSRMLRALWVDRTTKKKLIFSLAGETEPELIFLADLIAAGKIKPYVDRIFPLDQIAEAHAYVENGLKRGCVVISHRTTQ